MKCPKCGLEMEAEEGWKLFGSVWHCWRCGIERKRIEEKVKSNEK